MCLCVWMQCWNAFLVLYLAASSAGLYVWMCVAEMPLSILLSSVYITASVPLVFGVHTYTRALRSSCTYGDYDYVHRPAKASTLAITKCASCVCE